LNQWSQHSVTKHKSAWQAFPLCSYHYFPNYKVNIELRRSCCWFTV